jgi:hypothetical protein
LTRCSGIGQLVTARSGTSIAGFAKKRSGFLEVSLAELTLSPETSKGSAAERIAGFARLVRQLAGLFDVSSQPFSIPIQRGETRAGRRFTPVAGFGEDIDRPFHHPGFAAACDEANSQLGTPLEVTFFAGQLVSAQRFLATPWGGEEHVPCLGARWTRFIVAWPGFMFGVLSGRWARRRRRGRRSQ